MCFYREVRSFEQILTLLDRVFFLPAEVQGKYETVYLFWKPGNNCKSRTHTSKQHNRHLGNMCSELRHREVLFIHLGLS